MDYSQIVETLHALPPDEQREWLFGTMGVLGAMLAGLLLEWLLLQRSGRGGSWLVVRIVSAFAAPLTVAMVLVPARAAGDAGLLVLYLLVPTVGALVWFGIHALAGRWVRPALRGAQSILLGFSGLAILAIPATAYVAAQPPLYAAARSVGERRLPTGGGVPLVHTVQPVQAFNMPGAGVVYTQSLLLPPGVRLDRVEQRQGGLWPTERNVAHPTWCTLNGDVHLMWSVQEPAPYLRLHWLQSNAASAKGEFTPDMKSVAPPQDFTIGFRPDGLDPAVPIPRARVDLEVGSGPRFTDMLGSPRPEDVPGNDCLAAGYKRPRWQEEGPVQTVGIMFYRVQKPPLRALLLRPAQ